MRLRQRFTTNRLRDRRRKNLAIRIGGSVLVLALIVWGVYALFSWPAILISRVEVSGAIALDAKAIQDKVLTMLSGSYWNFFPRSNIALYPRLSIENSLASEFPRIKALRVRTQGWQGLKVEILEREAKGIWCRDQSKLVKAPSDCYLVDGGGFIFAVAPETSGQVYFEFVSKLEGEPLRQNFLEPGYFSRLSKFIESVKSLGVKPIRFVIRPDSDYELELEQGEAIIWGRAQDLEKIFENLQAVFTEKVILPDSLGDLGLDYIDLRFGNKIFFKPRE